jgi:hypothetical protein
MARNLACSKLIFSYAKPTWSRETRVCDPNRDRTNTQHKKEVLQYRKNSSHLTKNQQISAAVRGRLGNKVLGSQSETVTIPNTKPEYPTVSNRIMCVNTYSCNPAGSCVRTLDATQTKAECEAGPCVRNDYACVEDSTDPSYGFCREGGRPEGGVTQDQCEASGCPVWGCVEDNTSCVADASGTQTKAVCEASGCSYDCSYICIPKVSDADDIYTGCSGSCIRGGKGKTPKSACEGSCLDCATVGGPCKITNDCCQFGGVVMVCGRDKGARVGTCRIEIPV